MGEDAQTARMRHDAGANDEPGPVCQSPAEAIERIRCYQSAGATCLSIGFRWSSPGELRAELASFAGEVLPAFRVSS